MGICMNDLIRFIEGRQPLVHLKGGYQSRGALRVQMSDVKS